MTYTYRTSTRVYPFDELDDSAQDKALAFAAEGALECFDGECTIEDACNMAAILGIDLRQRTVKLMNGKTRQKPSVYWSGFWSQSDGASFDGSYSYAKGCSRKIREAAPLDTELHRIADRLTELQKPFFYSLTAECDVSGHYSHSGCMRVSVEADDRYWDTTLPEDELAECLRDFADWIYSQLEREWEYQSSREVLIEGMADQMFDETGRFVCWAADCEEEDAA